MISKIIQSKSKTFLAFCFCFLVADAFGTLYNKKISFEIFLYSFFPIFFLLPFFFKETKNKEQKTQKKLFFFVSCLLFFLLGLFRVTMAMPSNTEQEVSFYNGQKTSIVGFVTREPDIRTDGIRYVVAVQKVGEKEVSGKIFLKSDLYPRFFYGDQLSINCDLQSPQPIEDFRYDMYLAKSGVYSVCQKPFIEKIGDSEGSLLFTKLLFFKSIVANKINELWHEPYASFVAGVLYGYQGGLGNLQQDFNRTGITHIVAISGYNISLIATIFSTLLVSLSIGKKKAFFITVCAIVIFVIFVGASASVLRAGAMGVLALLGKYVGRPSRIFNVIILAITLLTIQNPYVLLWDAGFQLSVLSTLGLIYVSPKLAPRLEFVPKFFGLQENLASTLSAIVITTPLILFEFGRFSTVAPLVNLLVLPTVPWIMVFGALALILTFFHLPFGILVSYLTYFILKYVVSVVHWFSALPFAAVDLSLPLWGMVVCYIGLLWFLIKKDFFSYSLSSS